MQYKRTYNFWRNLVGAPFIWSIILPLVFLDIFIELYHRICFPLYRIPVVDRSAYIKFDRARLPYLKWWEKLGCTYCAYANGLLRYSAVIAAETERYWCSIKHQRDPNFKEPQHHKEFMEYGDEESYLQLESHYQKLYKKDKKE